LNPHREGTRAIADSRCDIPYRSRLSSIIGTRICKPKGSLSLSLSPSRCSWFLLVSSSALKTRRNGTLQLSCRGKLDHFARMHSSVQSASWYQACNFLHPRTRPEIRATRDPLPSLIVGILFTSRRGCASCLLNAPRRFILGRRNSR